MKNRSITICVVVILVFVFLTVPANTVLAEIVDSTVYVRVTHGQSVSDQNPTYAHAIINDPDVTMDSEWALTLDAQTAQLAIDISLVHTGSPEFTTSFGRYSEAHLTYEALTETTMQYSWEVAYNSIVPSGADFYMMYFLQPVRIKIYNEMNTLIFSGAINGGFTEPDTVYTGSNSVVLGSGQYLIILYEEGTQGNTPGPINWAEIGDMSFEFHPCTVTFEDFALFAQDWLASGASIPSDFDQSGTVDAEDLYYFTNYWLDYCPAGWPLK